MATLIVDSLTCEYTSQSFFSGSIRREEAPTFTLRNITFSLKSGEMMTILGPNGAGKTTLLRALMGYLPLKKGSIAVDDEDLTKLPTSQRARYMNLTFQLVNQYFHALTVFQELWKVVEVRYPRDSLKEKKKLLQESIEEFHLQKVLEVNPHFLSGGEKRRLSLAILKLINPFFYLFDEPTMGLDAESKLQFQAFLKKLLHSKKYGIIIVSHDMELLLSLNPRIIFLKNGRMYQHSSLHHYLLQFPLMETMRSLNLPEWIILLIKLKNEEIITQKEFLSALQERNHFFALLEELLGGD